MNTYPTPTKNTRIGFHYYPDSLHYTEQNLNSWIPELEAIGAQWLTLVTTADRAIPENFIRGLIDHQIEPVLHFYLPLYQSPKPEDLSLLFDVYANWGVHYVSLFKRPNCHEEWSGEKWVQQDLITRFLEIYLPLAEALCSSGMNPVFPPLEPGGDFWDTVFLRAALQEIYERGHQDLLDRMVIGAFAWADNLPLNWGAGGPERWAGARPYFTPLDEQDHMGFRIFDWYTILCEAVLGKKLPIILLKTGSRIGDQRLSNLPYVDEEEHATRNILLARLLAGEKEVSHNGQMLEPIPEHVLAGNFWLLASEQNSPVNKEAWYQADGSYLPIVQKLKAWLKTQKIEQSKNIHLESTQPRSVDYKQFKPIKHYLLLPVYEWGISDWHLEVIHPFVQKHSPTVGFSIEEACAAEKVTVIGGDDSFSPEVIERLYTSGCSVDLVRGSGTSIAAELERL
ncbi:MAG: hypothetical protein PVF83_15525 [Anaerolineales bacterium]